MSTLTVLSDGLVIGERTILTWPPAGTNDENPLLRLIFLLDVSTVQLIVKVLEYIT